MVDLPWDPLVLKADLELISWEPGLSSDTFGSPIPQDVSHSKYNIQIVVNMYHASWK